MGPFFAGLKIIIIEEQAKCDGYFEVVVNFFG